MIAHALTILVVGVLPALSAAAAEGRGSAPQAECDTQLVLAVDASGSVNADEFRLQMDGIAAAFTHPRVIAAATSGPGRCIEVALFQWSSVGQQQLVLDWARLDGGAAAVAIATEIADAPRYLPGGSTAVGDAMLFALALFDRRPCARCRQVLDVSGDGSNNAGPDPRTARDQADAAGIVVNALAILNDEPSLAGWYRGAVITPGGGVWVAETFEVFGDAILSKLETEVAWSPVPSAAQQARATP